MDAFREETPKRKDTHTRMQRYLAIGTAAAGGREKGKTEKREREKKKKEHVLCCRLLSEEVIVRYS